jgi:hypothetical protein
LFVALHDKAIFLSQVILLLVSLLIYNITTNKNNNIKMVELNDNQCEVVLVGCGAPNRGMGWYHAEQMLRGDVPSAKLCYVVEPWFLGGGM